MSSTSKQSACLLLCGLWLPVAASGSTDEPRFYVFAVRHGFSREHVYRKGSPIGIGVDVLRDGKLVTGEPSRLDGTGFTLLRIGDGERVPLQIQVARNPDLHVFGDYKGRRWTIRRWYILTHLECGDFILQVTLPESAGMAQPKESELPFRIVEPGNEDEWAWTLEYRARVMLELGRFEEAEELAWEVGRRYGIERLPWLTLAEIFDAAGDSAKSLEFLKEGMRRHIRKPRMTGDRGAAYFSGYLSVYDRCAVAAGEAKDKQEADRQVMDLLEKTRNGEDTGSIPDSYLEPLGLDRGPPWALVTACVAGIALGVFLIASQIWRARRRKDLGTPARDSRGFPKDI